MTSVSKFACALVLTCGLAIPAFAQNAANTDQSEVYNGNSNGDAAMHIGQALRAELTKSGFSNINIVPTSFMVRAKDSQGNPVMMVVSPDSVTAIMQENAEASNTTDHNATGVTRGQKNP
jgi:hypothetical protein